MSLDTLKRRVSVRRYEERPISDVLIQELISAAQRAPTSNNLQAVTLIDVRSSRLRAQIAALSGDQGHITDAPRFFVICADLARVDLACALRDVAASADFDLSLQAVVDGAIFGAHLGVCAEALGLGSVMIGGIRNDIPRLSRLLALPARCLPLFGICLGWPAERPLQKPRFSMQTIVHRDQYEPPSRAVVEDYDAALSDYYRVEHAWSARVARSLDHPASRNTLAAFRLAGFLVD